MKVRWNALLFPAFLGWLWGWSAWGGEALEVEPTIQIPVGPWILEFNHGTIFMCSVVALIVYALCRWLGRNLSYDAPSRAQIILESIVRLFDDLVKQSIGPNRGRAYLPYIGTLFLFLWTSNMMGLFPIPSFHIGGEKYQDYNGNRRYDPGEPFEADRNGNGRHDPGFPIPAVEEPTKNLNVTLGLALLFVVLIGHGSEIRFHGILGYLQGYFSPGGVIGFFMFPLNVVGKIAEVISISFRLFGNIFGGSVIISVVAALFHYLILPIGLLGFFGIFVGTVQAFVFTMLALTYIAMGGAAEES